ncbi:SpaA isopeptide-forming pilin-related protein [Nocardia alba]|uniref:Uncharacterized protein n=1 Tax=Nocardia alba TaxID=225051 RepID=A0A4R1FI45_9NOCA|nr:SpaA isopeptide-forming pilin-related protein [Nocardia alba]TCJ93710.1 hypothetical protein DFR71_5560 [Nocardia alba]
MRRTFLALSVLAPLMVSGVASADPAPRETGSLTAWTFTGREPVPVNRADIAVTPCETKQAVAKLVTGADGRATIALPAGCYEVKVVTVPGGCGLAVTEPVRVTVTAGSPARADFRFGCA